jgi:hypothetical protein
MEDHFLKEFVVGQSRSDPEPWYNPEGDCIIYQTSDEAIVAERIDNLLTIYRSISTNKAIGYQIKGVLAILQRFGLHGITVECKESNQELISLSLLLLAAYEEGPKTIGRRKAYADAFQSFSGHPEIQINNPVAA